jgi:rhodanese-related sulfurtransferase
MKTLIHAAGIGLLACAAAGTTYWIKGPPNRSVACDPALLKAGEVCLSRVIDDWQGKVIWVDARPRVDWQRDGVAGSVLWNLDETEDMQAFEAEAAVRMMDGQRVVVYCNNENCGVSHQIAERIRKLDLGNEVWVLFGGWRALSAAKLTAR